MFTAVVYMFWNLARERTVSSCPIPEHGRTEHPGRQRLGQSLWFPTTLIFVVLVFMPFGDGRYRRLIWGVGPSAR